MSRATDVRVWLETRAVIEVEKKVEVLWMSHTPVWLSHNYA